MANKMMYMPRDFVLRSINGHAVQFIANKPVRVPHSAIDEAIAIGAVFADQREQKLLVDEPKQPVAPDLGFERDQKIYDAMHKIAKRNNADDFTPGGKPKLAVVAEKVGYEVDRKEADKLWKQVMQSIANAD